MPDSEEQADAHRLLGRWRLLQADPGLDFAPQAGMEFGPGGRLVYDFAVGDSRQGVELVYRVEGHMLHTEVLATAHESSTPFSFGAADSLVFDFGGRRALFIREL